MLRGSEAAGTTFEKLKSIMPALERMRAAIGGLGRKATIGAAPEAGEAAAAAGAGTVATAEGIAAAGGAEAAAEISTGALLTAAAGGVEALGVAVGATLGSPVVLAALGAAAAAGGGYLLYREYEEHEQGKGGAAAKHSDARAVHESLGKLAQVHAGIEQLRTTERLTTAIESHRRMAPPPGLAIPKIEQEVHPALRGGRFRPAQITVNVTNSPTLNVETHNYGGESADSDERFQRQLMKALDSFNCELAYKLKRELRRIDAFDERCEFD
ncbi:MAG: hypothetical protein ACREQI_11080 [Candidatus Binataceae bacterium]